MKELLIREDARELNKLRPVSFELGVAPAYPGSVKISMGNTQVICGVGIEESVPRWMQKQKEEGGWLTAEYSMLPYSTGDRSRRENAGRISGRTQEIQRLIGRSLRAVMDLSRLTRISQTSHQERHARPTRLSSPRPSLSCAPASQTPPSWR